MYKKNDKKYLYWIIEMYLSGNIDEESFCDSFHDSFGLEINLEDLSEEEEKFFSDLNQFAGRYTPFKEDQLSGFLYNEEQIRRKIQETQKNLNKTLADVIEEELRIYDPSIEKSATILDETWLMCPDCIDAWECTSKNAMVICPKCNQVIHNPRWENNSDELRKKA